MTELIQSINQTTHTIPSTEVAEMIGKRHDNLMADIRTYIGYLVTPENSGVLKDNLGCPLTSEDYFIESTYINAQNKQQPMYLCTKMGCELIAHKLTGQKGVRFTALYVKRFNQMEQGLPAFGSLSPQLQLLINIEVEQKRQAQQLTRTNERLDSMGEILALRPELWRKELPRMVARIALKMGGCQHMQRVYDEAYRLLEERARCDLSARVSRKRTRMAKEGATATACGQVTKLDVIRDDERLVEIFLAIVKELAIREGVDLAADEAGGASAILE